MVSQTDVKEHYGKLAADYGARANQTCEETYFRLAKRFLSNKQSLLEIGSGSHDLLDRLGSPFSVACYLSWDMLRARTRADRSLPVAAAGEMLPFSVGQFDGLRLMIVLEHVTDLNAIISDSARVLKKGGIFLAVTPNGNWEFLLDLAERWSLKIPEGPHTFLTPQKLRQCLQEHFDVLELRTVLVFPAGPPILSQWIDSVTFCNTWNAGFFQLAVGVKRT